jgi:hypothetical protein
MPKRAHQPTELEVAHEPILTPRRLPRAYRPLTEVIASASSLSAMAGEHRFRSVVEAARGGGAVALIPPNVTAKLGGLKQMRVTGSLNGTPFRSSTMPYRGAFYLGVHKATREAAGVSIGDEVELALTRDDSPRVLELAPELEAALNAEPELRARFDGLSFSRRRELAEPIAEAKKPETRAARLEKALGRLRELGGS